MPQRLALYHDLNTIAQSFGIKSYSIQLEAKYNISPGQNVPVIIEKDNKRMCVIMRWGLVPQWSNDPLIGFQLANANAESIDRDKNFKNSLRKRRCIIPCSGYYLWERVDTEKKYYFIKTKRDDLFGLAGLWDTWGRDGGNLTTFTIITLPSNELLESINNRMGAILHKEDENRWLDVNNQDTAEVTPLLKPYPSDEMEVYEVSSFVNNTNNEGPECIEPVGSN